MRPLLAVRLPLVLLLLLGYLLIALQPGACTIRINDDGQTRMDSLLHRMPSLAEEREALDKGPQRPKMRRLRIHIPVAQDMKPSDWEGGEIAPVESYLHPAGGLQPQWPALRAEVSRITPVRADTNVLRQSVVLLC